MVFSSIVQQQLECQRERKLDLNAPLMSVRRQQNNNTSVSGDEHHHQDRRSNANDQGYQIQVFHEKRAPGYEDHHHDIQDQGEKLSWESLRSPGAVPFVWERTPGRPKSGHIETRRLAASACSSPALPPGRATMTWACSPANAPLSREANSVADLKANNRRRRKKRAAPRGRRQASLAELLARKRKGIGAGASSSSSGSPSGSSDSETEVVSESSSESFMAPDPPPPPPPPAARSSAKPAFDDPAARDFILKRFLPAAKAMADESASSSPYSSPLISSNSNAQQHAGKKNPRPNPSTGSPRNQVSASVERIQTYQYKFASGKKSDSGSGASGDDVFSLKACGFFSLNLLRHLRPQYPSSRLKRAGNRANNRFAEEEDDFRTSMLVKRVNGDLTIKHEGEFSEAETEDDHQQLHHQHHQVRKNQGPLKSPRKSPELFYDCDTNFEPAVEPRFNPRTPGRSYYRGSVSPLVESPGEKTRGFLGLPENYKPPDDPYRSGGYSPSIHQKERNSTSLSMMSARNQSSLAQRVARNAWVNNNTEGSSSPSSDSRNGAANLSWNSSSYCSIGEGSESNHNQHHHHRVWQEKKPEVLQSPARAKLPAPASPVSSLLPPKSPSQSWLWKALPLASPVDSKETSANWETTVKSRQLRPDHLRYSEENALESCQYYP